MQDEMTPEQVELLRKKCVKQDLHGADLFRIAVGALFTDKQFSLMEMVDGITEIPEAKELSPAERRKHKFSRWGYPHTYTDQMLITWLESRGQSLDKHYTPEELEIIRKGKCNE